jgi:nucleoside-diphosphate-sugar epimerase
MIVGAGLLATSIRDNFPNHDGYIVFASGVSNSGESRESEFEREKSLLLDVLEENKTIIYFSTCSIYDPCLHDSQYVMHKKKMEEYITRSGNYYIFRLPQVVGRTSNPNTLTNFLYEKIIGGEQFEIWRFANRNLIDVEHVALITNYLVLNGVGRNSVTNITSPYSISMLDLVINMEKTLDTKACYSIVDKGESFDIDAAESILAAKAMGVVFDGCYTGRLLQKYYGS